MHDTRLCPIDVKTTNNKHGTKRCKYKTCYDATTGVHSVYVRSKDQTPELYSYWVLNSLGDNSIRTAESSYPVIEIKYLMYAL